MNHLEIYTFGTPTFLLDGRPPKPPLPDKARALLIYIAIENQRPHRREHLAGLLWSDQPENKALHSLRQTLTALRKFLPEDSNPHLHISPQEVQFNPNSSHSVDLHEFAQARAAAFRHHQCQNNACLNIRQLQRAAALANAPFLDQFYLNDSPLFEEWSLLQRENIHRQVIEILTRLTTYHEQRGEITLARHTAERLLALAPWEETVHCDLMRLLAANKQFAAAHAQYLACKRLLEDNFGIPPSQATQTLHNAIHQAEQHNQPLPLAAPAPHNLPTPPHAFVGRAALLDTAAEILADPQKRLLTLTGLGGSGKTRLALEIAHEQRGLFRDGVFFVALAGLSRADQLAAAIAHSLNFRFYSRETLQTQLYNYLQPRQLLLILDNFEHLMDAAPEVSELLKRAASLKLICTSRQPLRLSREWLLELEGLPCPQTQADASQPGEAVTLFEQRALQIAPRFNLHAEFTQVTRICHLLEGLPLGIELTAAWVRDLPCEQIANQLEANPTQTASPLRDAPERHRSLYAAFSGSLNLLPAQLQTIFYQLSVFHGSFDLAAAENIAHASTQDLHALSERSLLRQTAPNRYQLHNLLRQFAAENLQHTPESLAGAQQRQRAWYCALLAENHARLQSPQQSAALQALATEVENLRAAWQNACKTKDAQNLSRAAQPLAWFYEIRAWYNEGEQAMQHAAESIESLPYSSPQQAQTLGNLLTLQAGFAIKLGQAEAAQRLLEQALPLLETHGTPRELAYAHYTLANAHYERDDFAPMRVHLETGLSLLPPEAIYEAARLHENLGDLCRIQGDLTHAETHYEYAVTYAQQLGAPLEQARAHNNLGIFHGAGGNYSEAEGHFQQALQIYREEDDRAGIARSLQNLSIVAYIRKDYTQARAMRQECLSICRAINFEWGIVSSLKHLGDTEKALGNSKAARAYYEESLQISQVSGARKQQAYTLNSLGNLGVTEGNFTTARADYREALHIALEIKLPPLAIDIMCGIAETVLQEKDFASAGVLLGFALSAPGVDQQTHQKAASLWEVLQQKAPALPTETWRQHGENLSLAEAARLCGVEV